MSDHHYPPFPCCGGLAFHSDSCAARTDMDDVDTEISALREQVAQLQADKGALYEERNRLRAMLDRIAEHEMVREHFDPKLEECVADGVESAIEYLADGVAQAERERDERWTFDEVCWAIDRCETGHMPPDDRVPCDFKSLAEWLPRARVALSSPGSRKGEGND